MKDLMWDQNPTSSKVSIIIWQPVQSVNQCMCAQILSTQPCILRLKKNLTPYSDLKCHMVSFQWEKKQTKGELIPVAEVLSGNSSSCFATEVTYI